MYCNKRNNEDDLLSPERSERTIPEQYQAEEKKLSADVLLGILVEEWGAACIRVTLPEGWRRFNVETLGPVRVVFADTSCLSICVLHKDVQLRYCFDVPRISPDSSIK